ncbi:NAD(P)/FAD-dependent oxidoreductase [Streptomyces sp. NPDC045431]|uniref:NAD(P)/FAD-dependent oxidoreductase n=1 Tax=Streptomyces sp. NPDC045431 TaxID=3155613 RepID=UPI003405767D
MSEAQYDVVVVGGGPAGSTIAGLLAKQGRRVFLMERESFPRYHIGESMVTGMIPVMEELGVVEELEKRFQHKSGINLVWGKDPQPWRSDFSATGGLYDHSWHVRRDEFDKLLLDRARELGVEVVEEAQVTDVLQNDDGRVTGVAYKHAGVPHMVRGRFVVDASGQHRTLTRKLTGITWQDDLRNVAIWGYTAQYTPLEHPDDILVEAIEGGGWMWGIPLAEDKLSIGYVLPVERLTELTRQGRSQQDVFAEGLASSRIAKTMADVSTVGELRTTRDWSHICDRFYGPGWVAVGDSAAFIDPLFSSGVWLGTSAAWLAARALDAALDNPAEQDQALERFDATYRQLYHDILAYVRFFMDPNRLREEYMERAQAIGRTYIENSAVGFITLISGIKALPDVVSFDPMGEQGLEEVMKRRNQMVADAKEAAAREEAKAKAKAQSQETAPVGA